MLPFEIKLLPGSPIYEQVIFAVKKAIVSGQLEEGDSFPSLRKLSKELGINPNTAAKIISHLTQEGILGVKPGIGTVVKKIPKPTPEQKADLLAKQLEKIVVEAKKMEISQRELCEALDKLWKKV